MYKLVISDDEGKTIIVPLVRDQITVGRQDGNTIRLTERNVSRQHARLVKAEKGYRVEDLESYNGVTLNGVRIDKQADLKDGDRVGIGDYVIALKAEADAVPATPSTPRASAPPTTGGAPARLVMISAPAPGAEFSIAKGAVRIGRLEELDLCISHRSISREHARVLQKDGAFEVEDLNSANGVRINGSATKKGALKSGDILELGQVRFRFVGPGETYVFEASEEEQAAVAPEPAAGPRRRTVLVIAVAAAVVGGVLAFMDDGDAKQGDNAQPVVEPEPQAASPAQDEEVRRQLGAALEGCRTALAAEQFADAVRAAQNGLALDETDATLLDCKRSAEDATRAAASFEQGKVAMAQGKLEDAYFLFAGLPESYRDRAEIKQATQRVALARLTEARKQLRSNPSEAKRLASSVLEMPGLTATMVQDAQRLEASADKAGASEATVAPQAPAPSRPARDPSAAPTAAKDDEDSPAKVARGCLARGDQRCAVRALEGHAESAQELALLIETYRALGETKKAVKHMESFVTRYPTARQAPQYRQFVAKHEQ